MPSKTESSKKKEVAVTSPPVDTAETGSVRPSVPQLLRGMKDVPPEVQAYWMHLRNTAESFAQTYGYTHIETPILESASLFERAIGEGTELLESKLYAFSDPGGDRVALRPEGRSGLVRAYIEHGMANLPQPVKLFSWGSMFRHERPQAGRLRQFHQFTYEMLGEQHPAADAELMLIGVNCFRAFAIPVMVQVNSVGCMQCRPRYLEELEGYLTANRTQLSEEARGHIGKSSVRIFASTHPEDREVVTGAPQMVDWLCEVCKQHFIRVLEYLDELEVPYNLSPFLVHGSAYYTKTIFEFFPATADGEVVVGQPALGGGGRYDALVEYLGGRPTPAVGIAFGVERVVTAMRDAVNAGRAIAPPAYRPNVFLAQLGEQAKRKAMRLFEQLRQERFQVAAQFSKDALKAQLELANRLEVALTLILGQKEVIDGTIIIREMSSGIQEIVAYDKVVTEIRKRLEQETVRKTTEAIPPPSDPLPDELRPPKSPVDPDENLVETDAESTATTTSEGDSDADRNESDRDPTAPEGTEDRTSSDEPNDPSGDGEPRKRSWWS